MSFFRRAGALIARFFTSAADPAAVAGEFQLYAKDDGGVSQLYGRSDDGAVHQITPPGGAEPAQPFQYTVTGVEPDLANLVITLPAARPSASYIVLVTQADATFFTGARVDNASRTTVDFVLSLGANATTNDIFSFYVVSL